MRQGKLTIALVMILLAQLVLVPAARAQSFKVEAQGAVLMDADSGEVLFNQDPDTKCYPASVTKLMTLLLALDAVKDGQADLQDKVLASANAASLGGSQVWLEPGEVFTLKEMLLAVAVGSANDASVAVAEHLEGSEEAFVDQMNLKAAEIGAVNTHFTNCHGLHDPDHYSTARDMGLIAQYAIEHVPEITQFTGVKEYTFREDPKLVLYNTNKLLWWYPGTLGLKTGTTSQGGRSLVTEADREGLRLIGVVLGSNKPNGHFSESIKLLNYGFSQYRWQELLAPGQVVNEVRVTKGTAPFVAAVTEQKLGLVLPKSSKANSEVRIELTPSVKAPVYEGDPVGVAIVMRDGQEVKRVSLTAANPVPRATAWQQTGKVLQHILTIGSTSNI